MPVVVVLVFQQLFLQWSELIAGLDVCVHREIACFWNHLFFFSCVK